MCDEWKMWHLGKKLTHYALFDLKIHEINFVLFSLCFLESFRMMDFLCVDRKTKREHKNRTTSHSTTYDKY